MNSRSCDTSVGVADACRLLIACAVSLPISSLVFIALSPVEYALRNGISFTDMEIWRRAIIVSYDKNLAFFGITCIVAGVQYALTAIPISLVALLTGRSRRFRTIGHFAAAGAVIGAAPWVLIILPSGVGAVLPLSIIAIAGAAGGSIFGAIILAPTPCMTLRFCS